MTTGTASRAWSCQGLMGMVTGLALLATSAIAGDARGPAAGAPARPIDPALYQALKWRNVGPFRAGRTTAVAGVPGDPTTFYIGSSGGGVWKTTDAGVSWRNVSDGFFDVGAVGAIAVAA